MSRYGASPAEASYSRAMANAEVAFAEGSSVGAREWLEAAEVAKRLVELERLSHLGRAGEALRGPGQEAARV